MPAMKIWVPGDESDDGLLIRDEKTGERITVSKGEFTVMEIPIGNSKLIERPAVRGEMLGNEGPLAIVRLPNGKTIRTKILVGWQLGNGNGRRPEVDIPEPDDKAKEREAEKRDRDKARDKKGRLSHTRRPNTAQTGTAA